MKWNISYEIWNMKYVCLFKCDEWNEMKWNEMKWNEMKYFIWNMKYEICTLFV